MEQSGVGTYLVVWEGPIFATTNTNFTYFIYWNYKFVKTITTYIYLVSGHLGYMGQNPGQVEEAKTDERFHMSKAGRSISSDWGNGLSSHTWAGGGQLYLKYVGRPFMEG